MHWSKYPEVHDKLVRPHMHPELEHSNMFGYMWRACVFPGLRQRYDGKPVDISNGLEEDEDWMEYPEGYDKSDVELNAGRILGMFGRGAVLATGKLICPIWSPFFKLA